MKEFAPRKVFILHNGEYHEIALEEHLRRKETDEDYQTKKFIGLHGMIMEVSETDYLAFYRARRRQKYLAEAAAERGDVSYDALTTDEFNGEDALVDPGEDIAEALVWQSTLDKLRMIIDTLPEEEKELIKAHFYDGKSQTALAEEYGVNQSNISRRIGKIIAKIKRLLEILNFSA